MTFTGEEISIAQVAINDLRQGNDLRMWETITRVSFLYQLKQTLDILASYNERLLSNRLKPKIEERNVLFNILQNALGNIRVFCRLRPSKAESIDATISRNILTIRETSRLNVTGSGFQSNSHKFEFFHVFGEKDTQFTVFEELRHFILSALHNCSVTLFAYGQTGSGKTYTMDGNPAIKEQRGILPRVVSEVFDVLKEWRCAGIELNCRYGYFEIYNESVRDLLSNGEQRDVKENAQGYFYVSNLTLQDINVQIHSREDIIDHVLKLPQLRTSGSTQANSHSSRSHSIFQLHFESSNETKYLTLIDLAGSERLAKTAATGRRAHEAKNINLSLSALNDTLSALGGGSPRAKNIVHIPFRQSKLTQLLKEPLCGKNSKVAMFVNISSAKEDISESINSLRFATKVQGVKISK
eukprot:GHVH01016507.1.p1 GENE.GHVH01016507.1~~GHVH01016507.1.p1  ORF type:complete len:412 (-),score=47.99 GHVH01016507.1:38-1273(-)